MSDVPVAGMSAAPRSRPHLELTVPAAALALVGGALVIAGGFLPWLSLNGVSRNAWDIPVLTLYAEKATSGGVSTGLLLLTGALVVVPVLARRRLLGVFLLGPASLCMNMAAVGLLFALRSNPRLTPGAGLLASLAGSLMVGVAHVLPARVHGLTKRSRP